MIDTAAGLWLRREGFLWIAVKLAALTVVATVWIIELAPNLRGASAIRLLVAESPLVAACGLFAARGVLSSRCGLERLSDLQLTLTTPEEWMGSILKPLRWLLVGQVLAIHTAAVVLLAATPADLRWVPASTHFVLLFATALGYFMPGYVAYHVMTSRYPIAGMVGAGCAAMLLSLLGGIACMESLPSGGCLGPPPPIFETVGFLVWLKLIHSSIGQDSRLAEAAESFLGRGSL